MAQFLSQIKRYPTRKDDTLQGWDGADELILEHLSDHDLIGKRVLIINDKFGALSCSLESFDCTTFTDSYISTMAIKLNSLGRINPFNDLKAIGGTYDYVIIQLPKNMSFFEDILCHLTHLLNKGAKVICGSMIKHMAPQSFELIHKYIGNTTTSLAKKKARLIFSEFTKERILSPYPLSVKMDGFNILFVHHSNLFSREKLDIGTRFFLEHIPKGKFKTILDLGCGNGIIGIKAKEINPQAKILFSDESAMAVASAKANYTNYFQDDAEFIWLNCFEGEEKGTLDLVLCNPPFHQQHAISDAVAWQMFQDAFKALKTHGILRVIGNGHLGYPLKLKKIFGNSRIIATNPKFVIIEAVK